MMMFLEVVYANALNHIDAAGRWGNETNALGDSIYTQGETMDELKKMIRDAVECHFEKGKAPQVIRLHSVHEEVISL